MTPSRSSSNMVIHNNSDSVQSQETNHNGSFEICLLNLRCNKCTLHEVFPLFTLNKVMFLLIPGKGKSLGQKDFSKVKYKLHLR